MDQFGNALHYVYGSAHYPFIPFDQVAPITVVPSQRRIDLGQGASKEYFGAFPFVSHSPETPDSPTVGGSSPPLTKEGTEEPRRRCPNRVPRPRNAFMIFRSEFWAGEKINRTVEHDHRHISRIVGHCWNQMSEEDKDIWRLKAEQEKLEHMQKYPDYKFTPLVRDKKPVKRNVKRNGEHDMLRCRRVADLLLAGKEGDELAIAISKKDTTEDRAQQRDKQVPESHSPATVYPPPFRSPLLPPSATLPEYPSPPSSLASPEAHSSYAHCPVSRETAHEPSCTAAPSDRVQSYPFSTQSPQCPQTPTYAKFPATYYYHSQPTYSHSPTTYSHSPTTNSYFRSPTTYSYFPAHSCATNYPESEIYHQTSSYPCSPTDSSPSMLFSGHSSQVVSNSSVEISPSYSFEPSHSSTGPGSSHIVFSNPFQPQPIYPSHSRPRSHASFYSLDPLQIDLPLYHPNH